MPVLNQHLIVGRAGKALPMFLHSVQALFLQLRINLAAAIMHQAPRQRRGGQQLGDSKVPLVTTKTALCQTDITFFNVFSLEYYPTWKLSMVKLSMKSMLLQ